GNEWWQTTEMRDPQSKPRMMESRTLLKGRDFYRPNGIRAPINYAPPHLQDTQDKTEAPAKIHRQTHRVVTVCVCVRERARERERQRVSEREREREREREHRLECYFDETCKMSAALDRCGTEYNSTQLALQTESLSACSS